MTIVWNAQRVSTGLTEIERARPVVFGRIKQILDEYHGVVRSARYYDILLGDFIERYLHLVYVAIQDNADEMSKDYEPVSNISVDEKIKSAVFRDTLEFFSAYTKLPTITLATLRTLINFGPTSISVSSSPIVINNSGLSGRRDKVVGKFLKVVAKQRSSKVLFIRPFSGRVSLSWVGAMILWRSWAQHDDFNFKYAVNVLPDNVWRQRNISQIAKDSSLAEVSCALLGVFLPAAVVEGFSAIRAKILLARPNRPAHIYSSQSLWTHLEFKILAAEWCELGTQLSYHQHGGWYGLDELHVAEQFERRVSDTYYTWGWSRGDKNTRILSPVIPRQRSRSKSKDSLICFDQPRQIYRLQYFPLSGTLQTMYDQVAEFVKLRNIKTELKIRLFPGDYGTAQREAILAARPDANFGNSEDIFEQYFGSRIVVHSYLGTSWLETLGMNIPTVCFYDPEAYKFRPDAKSLIDEFARVGILHTSGSSAATLVNKIDADVAKWWLSTEVQLARTNFAEKFANFSPDWKNQWQQEFSRLLNS